MDEQEFNLNSEFQKKSSEMFERSEEHTVFMWCVCERESHSTAPSNEYDPFLSGVFNYN